MPHVLSKIFAAAAVLFAVEAAACTVTSGPTRAALLELYTSEGCSSCPPADHWLGKLQPAPQRLVPLALHVDYWDYIGWQDKFAKPVFTERQRNAAGIGFVYTPQVMLNGQDFHGWRNQAEFEKTVSAINRSAPQADISLTLTPGAGEVGLNAAVKTKESDAAFYIAVYENDLTSQVRAGENGGATLHHDYVVREWLGPYPVGKTVQQKITVKQGWKVNNLGVAAFVQGKDGEVLQAVAGKLCQQE